MMNDILLNNELDINFADGDIIIGESTVQHQQLLLVTSKGDWKENPLVGVGAAAFLKDEDESGLLNEIRVEFQKDGMDVKAVNIQSKEINIDANY